MLGLLILAAICFLGILQVIHIQGILGWGLVFLIFTILVVASAGSKSYGFGGYSTPFIGPTTTVCPHCGQDILTQDLGSCPECGK